MIIKHLQSSEEFAQWSAWTRTYDSTPLWQSPEWKHYQESLGRETRVYAAFDQEKIAAAALVIIDRTMFGLSTWDIPRGPILAMSDERIAMSLLETIIIDAKQDGCMSVYLSPHFSLSTFHFPLFTSPRHEQPEATRIIDLTLSDEELLAQMHQKGRYNIKVAEKNGVTVRESTDIDAYYALAQTTSSRDAFGIPSKKQLQKFLNELPGSFLLLAFPSSSVSSVSSVSPIAGLIGIRYNKTGIYYYGASDYEHRALMAPYLLQWEAIKRCKAAGCTTYDLLGIAPVDAPADHPWSGISGFKEKFGGSVISYEPEQEIRLRPWTKKLLELKRKIVG